MKMMLKEQFQQMDGRVQKEYPLGDNRNEHMEGLTIEYPYSHVNYFL